MRRAFTITEILVVVAILLVIFAITFPIFRSSKRSAKIAAATEELRQLGKALAMYRSDYDDAPNALDSEALGLPPTDAPDAMKRVFALLGKPKESVRDGDRSVWYPRSSRTTHDRALYTEWVRHRRECGDGAIVIGDFTFNDSDFNMIDPVQQAFGLGLRLDTGVRRKTGYGLVIDPTWWTCQP